MENNIEPKQIRKSNVLMWILFFPLAFATQAIVIIILDLIFTAISINNQVFYDSLNAFVGAFLLVFCSGLFAPVNRIKVSNIIFVIFAVFDILNFIAIVSNLYQSAGMQAPEVIVPILSIFGGLYALTTVPAFVIKGITYDQLLGKIAGLGGMTTGIGVVTLVIGIIVRFILKNPSTLFIGEVLSGLGLITWAIPYLVSFSGMIRANILIEKMRQNPNSNLKNK
jgi:hypothetical protein